MPALSVIVPFYRDLEELRACLDSVRQSDYQDYELIVADDGGPDPQAAARVAAAFGAKVVRLPHNSGPATARNHAALQATGEILVFFDADVTAHRDTLARFAQAFRDDPSLDALIGSYDLTPGVHGLVGKFRNLLHSHVHHRSAGDVSTFWAGCGAVRRARFAALQGFDETFRQPSIEDVEFGWRLHRTGAKLRLDPAVQVTHHKEWTLVSMIHADVLRRARPWAEIVWQYGLPGNLNFRRRDRVSVMLATLLPVLLPLAVIQPGRWWIPALGALLAILCLQLPLFRLLWQRDGAVLAVAGYPLLLIHYWCAAIGFVVGVVCALRTAQARARQLTADS